MNQKEIAPAVVFLFYQEGQVLLEKRPANSSYPEAWIFPGGKVETYDWDIATALLREVKEELGVKPILFDMLPQEQIILSPNGRTIHPFLITLWEGSIPTIILDKEGSETSWIDLDEVIRSPILSVKQLAIDLKKYLES